jgi:hypothetical protein
MRKKQCQAVASTHQQQTLLIDIAIPLQKTLRVAAGQSPESITPKFQPLICRWCKKEPPLYHWHINFKVTSALTFVVGAAMLKPFLANLQVEVLPIPC